MKSLVTYPAVIYMAATMACLCIMIVVDFVLGPEAEHLNAWVILNRLFGHTTEMGDSLALRRFGLLGASLLTLCINAIFGWLLIQVITICIRSIQS